MSSEFLPTDMILLRMQGAQQSMISGLELHVMANPVNAELQGSIVRKAWAEHSQTAYVYLALPHRLSLAKQTLDALTCPSRPGISLSASRMTLMDSLTGASLLRQASFHYVVETTPETGWELELQRWYAMEHLPGLSKTPGCVQAQRFWNHDEGPRSFACYDLVDEQALASPEWLAVRETSWSDHVRPHFTNTIRTMFTIQL
ncbi:hypothetical protein QYQ99_26855 [Comamonas testosteroni]|uniref:hypothetical protein n=1 Tax=Comamonas testosteroni TaxID=285 RepID=UPI00266036FA|nr:hypothetical protein [Comamonas testosteroni]WKL15888.1 hypothetical protein QYQ99_26855 [Comamonas testosteroni]